MELHIWSSTQVRPRCSSNPRVQGVSHGVSVQRTGSCCCRDSDAWGRRVTRDTDKQTLPLSTLPTSSTPSSLTDGLRIDLLQRCTLCPKNVTTLSPYMSDVHGSNLIIFGTNVTEKVGNRQVLHFLPHLIIASALPGEVKKDKILLRKCCTVALPDFNQSLAKFIQSCYL